MPCVGGCGCAGPAGRLPGVLRVETSRELLRVFARRGEEVIAQLIKIVDQAGRTVTNIHLAPPSLETLFISLTGRKLE